MWKSILPYQRIVAWNNSLKRRHRRLLDNFTMRKGLNLGLACTALTLKNRKLLCYPPTLKIDISPLCNLRCKACVHAKPDDNETFSETLKKQKFVPEQKMTIEQFSSIINEVKDKISLISLYYLGEPFMHPNVIEFCHLAYEAGINVHISSNFSFKFSDSMIESIARCGLTHLTVCVDGITQWKYERTRIGGRIDLVLNNLKRLCEYKRKHDLKYPHIEIQYLKYPYNLDEINEAQKIFEALGVNHVEYLNGTQDSLIDTGFDVSRQYVPKESKLLPLCFWPYSSMVIKYNGDVIPCCDYRLGSQYATNDNSVIMGNVFKKSVWDVWNSPEYYQSRRLVALPRAVSTDSTLRNNYCYGCSRIFDY